MKIRAAYRVQLILLLVLAARFLTDLIYCVVTYFGGAEQPTVTFWGLMESVLLLISGIGLLVAFLSYTPRGWWVVVIFASALCIYDITAVLLFETGYWRYMYSFVVAIFYAVLVYAMFGRSLIEDIGVSPHRIKIIPKLFFSAAIAFLFMFLVGSELLSVFIGVLTLSFLSEKVNHWTFERAKRNLSKRPKESIQ